MEELYKKFGGKIEFIAINLGIKGELADYVKNNHMTMPVAFDEGNKVSSAFDARIETNVLINSHGVVTYDERGFRDDMDVYLSKLLD